MVAASREEGVEDGVLGWIVIDSLRLNLELVEGMVTELDRGELESGCVLGVVIELPMRDDIEELIRPFELAEDRLLTLDLEFVPVGFVVEEFLLKRLPILTPLFDLPADEEELEGSLPALVLPDGLDGILRFVIILLELLPGVMEL